MLEAVVVAFPYGGTEGTAQELYAHELGAPGATATAGDAECC